MLLYQQIFVITNNIPDTQIWEYESPVKYAREKERKYKNYSMCLVCKSALYGDVQLQLRSNTRPRNESIPQSLSFFHFFILCIWYILFSSCFQCYVSWWLGVTAYKSTHLVSKEKKLCTLLWYKKFIYKPNRLCIVVLRPFCSTENM